MFIVFDLDGTLALNDHRQHFLEGETKDWDGFFEACDKDVPNRVLIYLLCDLITRKHRVEIWSGRSDKVEAKTRKWLHANGLGGVPLRMRPADDFRSDVDLKEGWLNNSIAVPNLVFDDRQVVVDMWRRNSIVCAQVAPGDF